MLTSLVGDSLGTMLPHEWRSFDLCMYRNCSSAQMLDPYVSIPFFFLLEHAGDLHIVSLIR
jgi:hypothetical protein